MILTYLFECYSWLPFICSLTAEHVKQPAGRTESRGRAWLTWTTHWPQHGIHLEINYRPGWWRKHPSVAHYQLLIRLLEERDRKKGKMIVNMLLHTSATHVSAERQRGGKDERTVEHKEFTWQKQQKSSTCWHFKAWLSAEYVMNGLLDLDLS